MPEDFSVEYGVICDDIRREDNGKFIGHYNLDKAGH